MNDIGKETDAQSAPFVSDGEQRSRLPSGSNPTGQDPNDHRPALPLYQPVVLMIFPFGFGIILSRFLSVSWQWYPAACIAALCCALVMIPRPRRYAGRRARIPEIAGSVFLMVALAACGAFWSHARWNWFGAYEISRVASDVPAPVCVRGTAVSEPVLHATASPSAMDAIPRPDRIVVAVRITQVRDGDIWRPASGIVDLVIPGGTSHIRSGDSLEIFGSLARISKPTNPGQFDFAGYYRAQGRLATLRAASPESVIVSENASQWSGSRILSVMRRKLNRICWEHVSPERAGLASAILLGNREQLDTARRESFLLTGTVHLLAISGLHVGILAGLFFVLYRADLIRRDVCLIGTILFVIFYAWLVEFRPPVTRAAILIVLFCVARLKGRTNSAFNWLALAGLLVLILNPADLFQAGPQLSFLAVATIVVGYRWIAPQRTTDPLDRLIESTRSLPVKTISWTAEKIRAAFLVSAIVWIVAMPLVALRFHLSAPVALIINPLLLLPVAFALYGGLGTLAFGGFFPPAAGLCGRICDGNLALVEWCIAVAANVPAGHSWTAGPYPVAVGVFYAGLFFLAVWPPTRVSGRSILLFIICWTVFGWLVPDRILEQVESTKQEELTATFIDVGHGTSVLLQLPGGENILYDAGSISSARLALQNVSAVLWEERISHLDAVIISHADVDHFNALPGLFERFSVGSLIVSTPMSANETDSVSIALDAARAAGVRIETVSTGDQLQTHPSVSATVLNPPAQGHGQSDNADSIVLLVESWEGESWEGELRGRKLLLTGDLEGNALFELISRGPLDCDVVMAPHHGSRNSHPAEFSQWCSPEFVVVSCSATRTNPAVREMLESNGAQVLTTGTDGAIRFKFGEEIEVSTWNESGW